MEAICRGLMSQEMQVAQPEFIRLAMSSTTE